MIRVCPNCKRQNRLPTEGCPDPRPPVCASCRSTLFPNKFKSHTNSSSTSQFGIVYILKHIKGQVVKVGETKVNSADRLRDYSKAHSLKGFIRHKDYQVPLKSRQDVEKRAHIILESQGFDMSFGSAKEIFACTPKIAEDAVERAMAESEIYFREKESADRKKLIQDKLDKQKFERERAYLLFKGEIETSWNKSYELKNLKQKLRELPEELPVYVFWKFGVGVCCFLSTIFLLQEGSKLWLSDDIIYPLIPFLVFWWLHEKTKENETNNNARWLRKQAIESDIKTARKKFMEPGLQAFNERIQH